MEARKRVIMLQLAKPENSHLHAGLPAFPGELIRWSGARVDVCTMLQKKSGSLHGMSIAQ